MGYFFVLINHLYSQLGASVHMVSCFRSDEWKSAVETSCSLVISQRLCRQMLTTGPGPNFRVTFTSLEKTKWLTSLILMDVSGVCIDMCDLNILSVHQLVDSNSGPAEPTFWALSVHWCHLVLELSLAIIWPHR